MKASIHSDHVELRLNDGELVGIYSELPLFIKLSVTGAWQLAFSNASIWVDTIQKGDA